ncbi:hypothetical protein MPNT_50162 [Candidatus Methylacidithermus pantelleriae]|uniref:Uncharacterized protein n=2 Tax=Candidatus Methylacidithermus pantelleriae TaxID=2744239 RepID=A0A8J2BRZ6_9BACT|nr:hypothetical protein MPNT_50162 [Candidatus Methylacidithermus pantelleriae]
MFLAETCRNFCLALWLPLDGRRQRGAREQSRLSRTFSAVKDFACAYAGKILLPDTHA